MSIESDVHLLRVETRDRAGLFPLEAPSSTAAQLHRRSRPLGPPRAPSWSLLHRRQLGSMWNLSASFFCSTRVSSPSAYANPADDPEVMFLFFFYRDLGIHPSQCRYRWASPPAAILTKIRISCIYLVGRKCEYRETDIRTGRCILNSFVVQCCQRDNGLERRWQHMLIKVAALTCVVHVYLFSENHHV